MTLTPPGAQWFLNIQSNSIETLTYGPNSGFLFQSWPGKHGDAHSVNDLPRCVLVDPVDINVEFTDGQIPAQLQPSTLTFTLWARTVADLPPNLQRGTMLAWDLSVMPFLGGGAAKMIWGVTGGRVTEAILQLEPGQTWAARLTVKAVDVLADLASTTPAVTTAVPIRRKARERLVQIAQAMGYAIGLPTGTPDGANPPLIGGASPRMGASNATGNARDQLAAWCNLNDVVPAGIVTPFVDPDTSTYPNGYGSAVPSAWYEPALVNALSRIKYMVVPPTKPNPTKLPLRLANVGGQLQLVPAPYTDDRTAAVDGKLVEVPAQLRSGREHAPNVLRFSGVTEAIDNPSDPASKLVERGAQVDYVIPNSDLEARGPRARELPTLASLGTYDNTDQAKGDVITAPLATYAAPFIPDTYARTTTWAFDAVTVHVDRMTSDEVRSVVPKLIPNYPNGVGIGEAGDGQLIKHLTLFNLDPAVLRPADPTPQGYVTAARIHLESGRMTVEVTMTPAAAPSSGSRLTVGEVDAASWHAIPAGNIDRSIRVADLALVDA